MSYEGEKRDLVMRDVTHMDDSCYRCDNLFGIFLSGVHAKLVFVSESKFILLRHGWQTPFSFVFVLE